MSSRTWQPDHERIRRVRTGLGVGQPVIVRPCRMTRFYGRYTGMDSLECHVVTVRANLDQHDANFVLWHELGHAMQVERLAREREKPLLWAVHEFERQWFRQMRALGITKEQIAGGTWDNATYRSAPFEAEADALAEKHIGYPLLKTRVLATADRKLAA